jgi:OOP family OmpA-OmpF porin
MTRRPRTPSCPPPGSVADGRGGGARGLALAAALLLPVFPSVGALLCPPAGAAAIRLGDRNGPDSDHDGVADDIDRCPERVGPVDNIGCPDRDEDRDGLVDRIDRCPTVPGGAATVGCPNGESSTPIGQEAPGQQAQQALQALQGLSSQSSAGGDLVQLKDRRLVFAEPVKFVPARDELTPEGRGAVEAAARLLASRPQLRRVIVEGHVDEPGNSAAQAKDLSSRRAEVVKRILVGAGVPGARVRARGFGYYKLLDKSETPAAALKNNRIEILVFE